MSDNKSIRRVPFVIEGGTYTYVSSVGGCRLAKVAPGVEIKVGQAVQYSVTGEVEPCEDNRSTYPRVCWTIRVRWSSRAIIWLAGRISFRLAERLRWRLGVYGWFAVPGGMVAAGDDSDG